MCSAHRQATGLGVMVMVSVMAMGAAVGVVNLSKRALGARGFDVGDHAAAVVASRTYAYGR